MILAIALVSVVVGAVLGFQHGRRRRDHPGKVVLVETLARSSDFEATLKQAGADAAQVVRDNSPSRR